MKNVTKTAISIFMVLAFFSMVLPVQAIGNDTKPNPLFKNSASHIDRSRRPYYGNDAVVDTYLLKWHKLLDRCSFSTNCGDCSSRYSI